MKLLGVGGTLCRGWVTTLLVSAAIGAAGPAWGQEQGAAAPVAAKPPSEKRRVLVGKLSGAKTDSAREWIVQAFTSDGGYELVSDDVALDLRAGASEEEIAAAAAAEAVDVVVLGKSVFKNKAGWVAELEVYEGTTGKLIQKVEVSGQTFEIYERNLTTGEAVLPVTATAQGWPRPEEEPPAAEEPPPAPTPVAAPAVVAAPVPEGNPEWHSPLRLLVGSRLISRSFRYTDALADLRPDSGAMNPVDYPRYAPPMPRAEVRWYPGGHFTENWVSQLGIVAGYEVAVGQRLSYDANGDGTAEMAISETHDFWYAGLRGRIPIKNVALGLQVDYGLHRDMLSGDQPTAADLPIFPDVAYSQIEIGGDFEWRIEQLIVGLHGSYNVLLSVGEIGTSIDSANGPLPWFPNTKGTAVDFGAYAGWRLSSVFDVLVGIDMRAYGLDFGTIPFDVDITNHVVAGGATDRYLSAWLALVVKLPANRPTAPEAAGVPASGAAAPAGGGEAEDDFGSFD